MTGTWIPRALDMMRYQRTSPDVLPLSNGRKPTLKVCKEEDPDNGRRMTNYSHLEVKPLRGRPGSGSANHSPARDLHFHHISYPSDSPSKVPALNENIPLPQSAPSSTAASPAKSGSHGDANGAIHGGGGSGDVLLQWGHNKRSRRRSRTESRSVATSSPAGAGDEPAAPSRQTGKIQRRSAIVAAEKVAAVVAASTAMPPPCGGSYGNRGGNLRPCTPLRDATSQAISNSRGAEERSNGVTRSEKRSPSSPPEKAQKTSAGSTPNGAGSMHPELKQQHHPSRQETGGSGGTTAVAAAAGTGEKTSLEPFEWPRIYISLSRKEKEDDFLVMKGTKLPQRPKKRAKNIDKTLQYCFPGMWLSDLTRGRYEVREKKCIKKSVFGGTLVGVTRIDGVTIMWAKRRGLKGMQGMDSDSE